MRSGSRKLHDSWHFTTKDDLIHIKNIKKEKILGATNEGKVILEDLEEDSANQLWKKGEPDNEGYFSLENSQVPKVMTAISSQSLEIQGNITQKQKFN